VNLGKIAVILLMASLMCFSTSFGEGSCQEEHQKLRSKMTENAKETADTAYYPLVAEGKKCVINENYHFIYKLDKRPKMGTSILRVELFNKQGKRDTSWKIVGNFGMPSMSGAHDSGDMFFKLNQKGIYLLPINIVMPGQWEVKLKFIQNEKIVYRGNFKLSV